MPLAPFIPAGPRGSETRRTRLALGAATVGIAAALLAYAIAPGVRHAVRHAAGSVREEVGDVFDHGRRVAPGLPSVVLRGPRVDLANVRGQRTLLVFWGAACAGCAGEARGVEEVARAASSKGHPDRVVGIACGVSGSAGKRQLERYHWSFPNLLDETGRTCAKYGAKNLARDLPLHVVIDAKGRIAETLRGARGESVLARALRS